MKNLSNNEINEIINCLSRMRNDLYETFAHIESHVSKELKDKLSEEIEKFVDEENKRLN